MSSDTKVDVGAIGLGRGGRMSQQHRGDAVLRLLRGQDLESVLRSLGVSAATLLGLRAAFLATGEASLFTRPLHTNPKRPQTSHSGAS